MDKPLTPEQALRDAAHLLGWLGAQGNTIEGSAWDGVCAAIKILHERADRIEAEQREPVARRD